MSSMKSPQTADWRQLALHIGLGIALLTAVAVIAWAADDVARSAGWSVSTLAAAVLLGAIAVGALVGIGGSHLSRELALGLAALSMLVYGAAVALQWDATPGSFDCPEAQSCEHGFALGGILIAFIAIPFGVGSCFAFQQLVRRTRQKFRR